MLLPRSAFSKCVVYSQFRVHKMSTRVSDSTTAGQHGWKIKDRDRCWLWYRLVGMSFIQCSLNNSILVVLIDWIIRFRCLTRLAIHLSEKRKMISRTRRVPIRSRTCRTISFTSKLCSNVLEEDEEISDRASSICILFSINGDGLYVFR